MSTVRSVTLRRCVAGALVVSTVGIGATVIAFANAASTPSIYETPLTWTNVLGTSADEDFAGPVAIGRASSGDLYVAGSTEGAFPGFDNQGYADVFVTRYDKNGKQVWLRQFGTDQPDIPRAIAVSSSGDVYIIGSTYGPLGSVGAALADADAFVARYDKNGNRKWVRVFGSSPGFDRALAVATAGSNEIYITGSTDGDLDGGGPAASDDGFITRFDKNGNQKWVRQFGTTNSDAAEAVATRGSEIYVAGSTGGSLGDIDGPFPVGGTDGFLMRFDKNGNAVWRRQIGSTAFDTLTSVAVAGKNDIYVGGRTLGEVVPGGYLGSTDGLVARYDKNGSRIWVRQLGTSGSDKVSDVKATTAGVFVVGSTSDDIDAGGPALAVGGINDLFVMKLSSTAVLLSSRQLGTTEDDNAGRLVLTSTGHPVIVGFTEGALWGHPLASGVDVLIAQIP